MGINNAEMLIHKKLTGQLEDGLNHVRDIDFIKLEEDIVDVWDKSIEFGEDINFDSKKAFEKFSSQAFVNQSYERPTSKIITLRNVMAIAALFAMAFFAFNILSADKLTTIDSGSIASSVVLPEGSTVMLSPNSKISYSKSKFNGERRVHIDGAAVFHAEKNGAAFVVEANGFEVKVLGTTFLVESNQNKVVKVLEGKVEVSNSNNKKVITDRESIKIENEVFKFEEQTNFEEYDWYHDSMIYNNSPLSKFLSDIESKFKIQIKINNPESIKNCTFTSGSLDNLELDKIITILESTFNTKLTQKNGLYNLGTLSCK